MSYEDLEEARAKRAVKEKAFAGKAKRGRKRKSPSPEVDAGSSVPKRKAARMSEMLEPAEAPVAPWRAPVARMY